MPPTPDETCPQCPAVQRLLDEIATLEETLTGELDENLFSSPSSDEFLVAYA